MGEGNRPLGPVIAVDPGREKCGIALLAPDGQVLHRSVATLEDVGERVVGLVAQRKATRLVLGDRTAAREVQDRLRRAGCSLQPILVDEHRSTELARRRYFREKPPRGWRRLLPVTLQTPPEPYDDYVAVILAERYLASQRPG